MQLTKLFTVIVGSVTLLTIFPLTSFSQDNSQQGEIHGLISDSHTGNYLSGADVSLSGTNFRTAASPDGTFSIGDVPVGTYTLVVSYMGYESLETTVNVSQGSSSPLLEKLSSSVVSMSAFVVGGAIEGQARALNQQKTTTAKVNLISSDAIGNFPDQNAAQSLQRVSGVSVQQLFGQATTVSIRGAGSDFNTTTLDGVAMMSNAAIFGQAGGSSANGRSVSLSDFPSQILSSVAVVKTVTPDLEANAIGGIVQLKTKSPFDFSQPVIEFNAGLEYSSEAQKFAPQVGMAVIERLGKNGDWGFAVTAADERRKGLEEQIEVKSEGTETFAVGGQNLSGYTILQPEFGNYDYDEHRLASSISLEKKFGDVSHLYVRATRTLWIQKSGHPIKDHVDKTPTNALFGTTPVTLSGCYLEQ